MTWTELSTPDGPMRVWEASPEGEPKGAVIVVQEAFGVNDHIRDVAGRFAKAGWYAVAPEFFHRAKQDVLVAPYDDLAKVMPLYEGLDDNGVLNDIDATLELLHARGFQDGDIGIVGFCWGGRVTFLVAARRPLGAAVGFYGGGIARPHRFAGFPALIDETPSLKAPWMGLFGDEDPSIPVADVEALRDALESAPVDTEIVRYEAAGHGFHCDARPDSYDEDAAKDGWSRALAWFDEHIKR
jgi:carboxymethylenebutenolidase